MKTLKNVILLLLIGTSLAIISCNNNPAVTCANNFNYVNELQPEIMALNTAVSNYSNDQTTANCEAYRSALLNYIDGLRDLEECARQAGQLEDWQSSLDEAEDSANSFQC